jgi:hypothetical protein
VTRVLTVRVADLFAVDPATAHEAAGRAVPDPIVTHIAGTAAGTVVTLESRLSGRATWRRSRAVRRLRTVLSAMQTELESATAGKSGTHTPDHGGCPC